MDFSPALPIAEPLPHILAVGKILAFIEQNSRYVNWKRKNYEDGTMSEFAQMELTRAQSLRKTFLAERKKYVSGTQTFS